MTSNGMRLNSPTRSAFVAPFFLPFSYPPKIGLEVGSLTTPELTPNIGEAADRCQVQLSTLRVIIELTASFFVG